MCGDIWRQSHDEMAIAFTSYSFRRNNRAAGDAVKPAHYIFYKIHVMISFQAVHSPMNGNPLNFFTQRRVPSPPAENEYLQILKAINSNKSRKRCFRDGTGRNSRLVNVSIQHGYVHL